MLGQNPSFVVVNAMTYKEASTSPLSGSTSAACARTASSTRFDPRPVRKQWEDHFSGHHNWQYSLWNVLMFQALGWSRTRPRPPPCRPLRCRFLPAPMDDNGGGPALFPPSVGRMERDDDAGKPTCYNDGFPATRATGAGHTWDVHPKSPERTAMRIAVVGTGYAGLVTAACLAELGHDVISVDNDREKLERLKAGAVPIHEPFLTELVGRHRGWRLLFSSSVREAVAASEAIFITVGTPTTDSGQTDLSYVDAVAQEIGGCFKDYRLVVEKSTVPIFTHERIRRTMLAQGAESFDVAANPEFLREGNAVVDFLYPDRIVVGTDSERATGLLRAIYEPLTSGTYAGRENAVPAPEGARVPALLITTNTTSAELIKHASNAYLAMKISFANGVATICEAIGTDVVEVCRGIGADSRIGSRFLQPGIGFGGSCLPKDLRSFRSVAQECGCDFRLLDEVMRINTEQQQRFIGKVRKAVGNLQGKRLAVLGLAFKGGTDDIRESPAIALIRGLLREGAVITAHDPAAMERAREEFADGEIRMAQDPYQAAAGCDALLILTDWDEFTRLDLERLRGTLKNPVIVDGRNLYAPEAIVAKGFAYHSMGRREAVPARPAREKSATLS
jgi:UDPglucose 6-dehydrogenase